MRFNSPETAGVFQIAGGTDQSRSALSVMAPKIGVVRTTIVRNLLQDRCKKTAGRAT